MPPKRGVLMIFNDPVGVPTQTKTEAQKMHKISSPRSLRGYLAWPLILILSCALTAHAQAGGPSRSTTQQSSPEQRTALYFESIRKSPPQELAFLLKMPKGGDLHNHLSGAIYAESYIQWAADNGLCVNT